MGERAMDCRYRDYFLFCTGYYDYVIATESLLIDMFDCKFSPPYNHFEHGKYDGMYINRYITHMISVPIHETNNLLNFIADHNNSIGVLVAKFNSDNNSWDIL